jgi:hypothetical protein
MQFTRLVMTLVLSHWSITFTHGLYNAFSLHRLRAELTKLINSHAARIKEPSQSAAFSLKMNDGLLKMLSVSEFIAVWDHRTNQTD